MTKNELILKAGCAIETIRSHKVVTFKDRGCYYHRCNTTMNLRWLTDGPDPEMPEEAFSVKAFRAYVPPEVTMTWHGSLADRPSRAIADRPYGVLTYKGNEHRMPYFAEQSWVNVLRPFIFGTHARYNSEVEMKAKIVGDILKDLEVIELTL